MNCTRMITDFFGMILHEVIFTTNASCRIYFQLEFIQCVRIRFLVNEESVERCGIEGFYSELREVVFMLYNYGLLNDVSELFIG